MKVADWLRLQSLQLSDYQDGVTDQQFVHWPRELLLSHFNEAICFIASLKPQDFIRPVVVRLLPGSTQTTCCDVVGKISEHVTENGSYISRIQNAKSIPTWRGNNTCTTAGVYVPQQTYRSSDAPNSFDIYPPVPSTGAYYVKILCSQAPTEVSVNDLAADMPACKHYAAINAYVAYKCMSGETDTALFTAATQSYKVFTDLMGIQNKAEMAFQKDITE